MTTETILLLVLVLVLIGAIPRWPHSQAWNYGPSGILAFVLLVVALLLVLGGI